MVSSNTDFMVGHFVSLAVFSSNSSFELSANIFILYTIEFIALTRRHFQFSKFLGQ